MGVAQLGGSKDIFAAKLNLGYAQIWAKAFGVASDQIRARLAVTSAADLLFTGRSGGSVDHGGEVIAGGGGADLPLVKLQAKDRAHLWSKLFGDAAAQAGVALAAMPDKGVCSAATSLARQPRRRYRGRVLHRRR